MQTSTLSSKNQITVPSGVRQQLRIGSGDRIRFQPTKDGRFLVEAVPSTARSDGAARRRLAQAKKRMTIDIEAAISATVLADEGRIRRSGKSS